ncbi:MAG: tRNA (adenosine(37)-N6)-threonylcarbamoyltransferase complex dimerization subunit type 1 TsaB [Woeseia sp.]
MKLLALETSTLACSVALCCDGAVSFRHELEARQHTRRLLPMINELLTESALLPNELDAIVLGNGPGSFIGMRIAASVAQGLCFASGTQLVPVSSLEALALAAFDDATCEQVLVAQDARMNEVYLAAYSRGADGLPQAEWPVRLQHVDRMAPLPGRYCAAGAGWQQYPDLWTQNENWLDRRIAPDYPHARELIAIGARRWQEGAAIAPEQLEPAYVRERVAAKPGETGL